MQSTIAWPQPSRWRCPSCGARNYEKISRKAVVTALLRCLCCRLLYRAPTDKGKRIEFYQTEYISGGLTTALPHRGELQELLSSNFRGTDKDFGQKIAVVTALGFGPGSRLLDYGASWGYAVHQFRKAGFDATGYEISVPRANYGRANLNVSIATREDQLKGPFDVVFSSHVIEHLADPCDAFTIAQRLLRRGGVFFAFTPNGSLVRRKADPRAYDHTWGRLHPVYLDDGFCQRSLEGFPSFLTTREYGCWGDIADIADWNRRSAVVGDLSKSELLAVFVNC